MMMFKSLRMASPICIIFTAMIVSALVTLGAGEQSEIQPHERQKRDLLFGLCYFMEVYTRRSCLNYLSYGCFCGAGNAGEDVEPRDSVDRCCKVHDECYGRAESRCGMKPHHVPYLRLCYKGCGCASTRWNSYCQYYTCNCDLDFARCLRRASFSSYYKNYNRKRC